MLGYAKLFKEKVLQEGREEGEKKVLEELARAHKEGKTLEEVLANHPEVLVNDNSQQEEQSNPKQDFQD